jgi:hypothetical protein
MLGDPQFWHRMPRRNDAEVAKVLAHDVAVNPLAFKPNLLGGYGTPPAYASDSRRTR